MRYTIIEKILGIQIFHYKTKAVARLSTCKNSRLGKPEPQTSTLPLLLTFDSRILRMSLGRTCDVFKSKLSLGP